MSDPGREASRSRETGLIVFLVILVSLLCGLSPAFRSPALLLDQSRYWVEIGILSAAMFGVVLAGGIDLSVGSVLALCGVAIARLHFDGGLPAGVAVVIGLLLGTVAGTLNGLVIVLGRIPDLVVTLATLVIFRGLAQLVGQNRVHANFPAGYRWLGDGSVLGLVPVQWVVLLLLWSAALWLYHRTRFGRLVFATGASRVAARNAGVPVGMVSDARANSLCTRGQNVNRVQPVVARVIIIIRTPQNRINVVQR